MSNAFCASTHLLRGRSLTSHHLKSKHFQSTSYRSLCTHIALSATPWQGKQHCIVWLKMHGGTSYVPLNDGVLPSPPTHSHYPPPLLFLPAPVITDVPLEKLVNDIYPPDVFGLRPLIYFPFPREFTPSCLPSFSKQPSVWSTFILPPFSVCGIFFHSFLRVSVYSCVCRNEFIVKKKRDIKNVRKRPAAFFNPLERWCSSGITLHSCSGPQPPRPFRDWLCK